MLQFPFKSDIYLESTFNVLQCCKLGKHSWEKNRECNPTSKSRNRAFRHARERRESSGSHSPRNQQRHGVCPKIHLAALEKKHGQCWKGVETNVLSMSKVFHPFFPHINWLCGKCWMRRCGSNVLSMPWMGRGRRYFWTFGGNVIEIVGEICVHFVIQTYVRIYENT